jgi:hypothetical protein
VAQYEEIYDKSHLTAVENEKAGALSELEKTYGDMIGNSDTYFDKMVENTEKWGDKQTEIQNQQLAFTEEKIQQQREQAQKDYIKEQSGAYVDWQKQSNQYGVEAEKMAAQGLKNTGFSETSQVAMYSAYQNRVAIAREAFVQASLNYDNAIKEARLQNSATLAEIAFQTYQKSLELSLQGFQYKNSLISELTDKKLQTKQYYSTEQQRIVDQINQQNALAEQVRQYNLELERQKEKDRQAAEQAAAELKLAQDKLAWKKEQASRKSGIVGGSGGSNKYGTVNKQTGKIEANSNSSDLVVVNSPYTPEGAAQKVASGELIVTKQEGNRIWVAPNPNYIKGQSLLDKYTSFVR